MSGSSKISSELRELVPMMPCGGDEMTAVADRIDAEHRRRMDDCRREVRREVIRYMRGVLTDLDRGVRRVRKGDKAEVVRCRDCENGMSIDGHILCMMLGVPSMGADDYCSHGERRKEDDDRY